MIKSKVRRRRVAKWRRNGHPHPAFDALAMMGEPRWKHPQLLFNGEVAYWGGVKLTLPVGPHFIGGSTDDA